MTVRQPKSFEETVDAFQIELLKQTADFVLKPDGDLALTGTGDLLLGDQRYSALVRLVQRWRFVEPTLETMFERTVLDEDRVRLDRERDALFDGQNDPFANDARKYAFIAINEMVAAMEFGRASSASAIVLVVDEMMSAFRSDLGAPSDCNVGDPKFSGYSLGRLLSAAGNSFRHADEWMRTVQFTGRQLKSIEVLRACLPSAHAGQWHPTNSCAETLSLISEDRFGTLSNRLFRFAQSLENATR